MKAHNSQYHGGYGPCGVLGKVWVDDGQSSNWYVGGPSCPACERVTAALGALQRVNEPKTSTQLIEATQLMLAQQQAAFYRDKLVEIVEGKFKEKWMPYRGSQPTWEQDVAAAALQPNDGYSFTTVDDAWKHHTSNGNDKDWNPEHRRSWRSGFEFGFALARWFNRKQ